MTRFADNGTSYLAPCLSKMKYPLLVAIACTVAACAPEQPAAPDRDNATLINDNKAIAGSRVAPKPTAQSDGASLASVLTLEGLGDLSIGRPVPAGSKWAERGAQTSDMCRTISSPDYLGVYAIIE